MRCVRQSVWLHSLTGVRTPCTVLHMTNTLKVRIPLTVEIDVDAWVDEYGTGSATEIRSDIKAHIESMVRSQLDALGVSA